MLRSLLYEVMPNDPLTLVSGECLMRGVALLACVIPARRAARVDPRVAMRAAHPFRIADNVLRLTPRESAASVTLSCKGAKQSSRRVSPRPHPPHACYIHFNYAPRERTAPSGAESALVRLTLAAAALS